MKEKGNTNAQQQAAESLNPGTRSDETVRKKDKDRGNEGNVKIDRHWTKRLAKRNYHPDGPGGSYDGL